MPHRPTHIAPTCPTGTNACGRLQRVDDGTGYQIFAYDRLGNVAENIRAIALPFEDSVYNFRMLFEYDSWNRVQRIVYPDSEVVTYNYDLGGQLYSVSTFKNNVSSSLINSILYDEFGHRTQVNFGNGVTTNYNYDILQRLSLLETQKPNSPALQKISYSFDNEDNITRVANTTAPVNGIGGGYIFDYQYDNLYRLTSSTGSFAPTNASYFLEMHYTPAGRICRKEQGDNNATKRLLYSYNPHNAPHAARRIYDPSTTNLRQMLWDANGNIAQIAEYLYDATNEIVNLQDFRNHYWDEDDRLNLVLDNSHFSYYLYGSDGQRVAKLTGSAFTLGTGFATNALLDNYTLYPSEYLVVTQQGYTKYYYANGTRIASKLGSGGFEKMTRLCILDQSLTYNANILFNSVVARIGEDMPQDYNSDPCPAYNYDMAGFRVPLQPLNFETNFGITAQQNILQAFRQNYANEETYYFHGNHLGSANWVTLQNASPTQFLLHLPYGEEFVKQQSGSYDERFTFTGKEKDVETGYYYFGARFDNVDLGFMSVDPMSDKYPSLSPYAYCAWNPVKLVDPEGESTQVLDNGDGTYKVVGGNIKDGDNGIYLQRSDGSNGKLLAYSATPESFYNSEKKMFMGTINPNDYSGNAFLKYNILDCPLIPYMIKALPKNKYDFKRTNGTNVVVYKTDEDYYRGMPIGEKKGLPIWASARDVGNIAAGYIAGRYGFSWSMSRLAFDTLESCKNKKISTETSSTIYAQKLGFRIGTKLYHIIKIAQIMGLPYKEIEFIRNTVPMPQYIIK